MHEDIEKYLWQPGEREQHEREMAERQQRIDREAREAAEREAATRSAIIAAGQPPVMKSYGAPAQPRVTNDNIISNPSASVTKEWQDYIEARIKREARATEDAMCKAIARSLGAELDAAKKKLDYETKQRRYDKEELKETISAVRNRFDEFERRLDWMTKRLEQAEARCAKLEAHAVLDDMLASRGLKIVS
jgi:hypothetical protein